MKQFVLATFLILTTYFLSASVFGYTQAAFLDFDSSSFSVNSGDVFDVQLLVDAVSDQITSVDAYIVYDPNLIEAQTVTPGSYFPTVINNIVVGKVYIAGLVDNPATYQTGSGTVATITFKALIEGSGTLSFDCNPETYNSSKVIKNDLNATNIIDCNENGAASITVGAGGGVVDTPTPRPTGYANQLTISHSALPRAGRSDSISSTAMPGFILLMSGIILLLLSGVFRIII